jgi:hypothetical protein
MRYSRMEKNVMIAHITKTVRGVVHDAVHYHILKPDGRPDESKRQQTENLLPQEASNRSASATTTCKVTQPTATREIQLSSISS